MSFEPKPNKEKKEKKKPKHLFGFIVHDRICSMKNCGEYNEI